MEPFDGDGQEFRYALASIIKLIQDPPKLALLALNPIGRQQHIVDGHDLFASANVLSIERIQRSLNVVHSQACAFAKANRV